MSLSEVLFLEMSEYVHVGVIDRYISIMKKYNRNVYNSYTNAATAEITSIYGEEFANIVSEVYSSPISWLASSEAKICYELNIILLTNDVNEINRHKSNITNPKNHMCLFLVMKLFKDEDILYKWFDDLKIFNYEMPECIRNVLKNNYPSSYMWLLANAISNDDINEFEDCMKHIMQHQDEDSNDNNDHSTKLYRIFSFLLRFERIKCLYFFITFVPHKFYLYINADLFALLKLICNNLTHQSIKLINDILDNYTNSISREQVLINRLLYSCEYNICMHLVQNKKISIDEDSFFSVLSITPEYLIDHTLNVLFSNLKIHKRLNSKSLLSNSTTTYATITNRVHIINILKKMTFSFSEYLNIVQDSRLYYDIIISLLDNPQFTYSELNSIMNKIIVKCYYSIGFPIVENKIQYIYNKNAIKIAHAAAGRNDIQTFKLIVDRKKLNVDNFAENAVKNNNIDILRYILHVSQNTQIIPNLIKIAAKESLYDSVKIIMSKYDIDMATMKDILYIALNSNDLTLIEYLGIDGRLRQLPDKIDVLNNIEMRYSSFLYNIVSRIM